MPIVSTGDEMWSSANMAFAMLPQLNVGEAEVLMLAASDALKAGYLANWQRRWGAP